MTNHQSKLPISVLILAPTLRHLSESQRDQLTRATDSAKFAAQVLIVEQQEAISDFAAVRNQAMKQAEHEWIFFLDSDEWFGAGAADAIAVLLSNQHVAGISIRRVDVFHHKVLHYGETGRQYILRFMRKDKSCFIRPVHETAQVIGLVKNTELVVWHEGHHSVADFFTSIVRYSELEASWRVVSRSKVPHVSIVLQLLTYPTLKFLLNYLGKGGFLDGWHGLVYATMMSLHSLFVRIFWLEKISRSQKNKLINKWHDKKD